MSLAADVLRTLKVVIEANFSGRIKRVRIVNDTVLAQNLNVLDLPLCSLWTVQEQYEQGEIADTMHVITRVKVMLITQAPTIDDAAFDDMNGIFPLSRDLVEALQANKSLNGLVSGMDLGMRIDDFDVQATDSMGKLVFSGVGRNIFVDYKKFNQPWSGWRMDD